MPGEINLLQIDSGEIGIGATDLFQVGSLTITNSMTSGFLVFLIIILIIVLLNKNYKVGKVPGKFQLIMEILASVFFTTTNQITGKEVITKRIFPIIGTIFLYIGISNIILNVLPGVASITYGGTTAEGWPEIFKFGGSSFFRTHTNDYSTTFGIAAAVVIWTHIYSIQKNNIFGHLNKYIRIGSVIKGFKSGIGAGLLSLIDIFIGVLDIVSEFAKTISISLRLFGNMFAGELLAAIVLSFLAPGAPVLLIFMGIFTGVLQALVFGALTASYFSAALSD